MVTYKATKYITKCTFYTCTVYSILRNIYHYFYFIILFLENKIDKFWIDGGGDIYSYGTSLKIGLEHPANPEQVIGVVEIKNQSICASSGNRRKWGKYHHIIDPEKLESADEVLATWVIASKAIIADSLATSLFLVSPEKLKKEFEFEYLILLFPLCFH